MGCDDIMLGTFRRYAQRNEDDELPPAAYLILSKKLETLDKSDGFEDGLVNLFSSIGSSGLYVFVDPEDVIYEHDLHTTNIGADIDSDGTGDILIGAWNRGE